MHKKTQYTVCHPIILVNIFAILQSKCYSSSNSQEVNVPKLRFKRADGSDYEQYKKETVGSLFTYTTRRNTNMECVNVITNSAELGLIPQREFFDKDIAVEENTEKYYVIEQGDFVYNPRKSASAPYGPFNCYKRIDEGIVSPLYTCLKPLFPEYTDFLLWYFASPAWHSYIYHNGAQGGARHDRVGMTKDLMDGIPVNIPEFEEQEKISKFLLLIEHRLELQRKLVDALKSYKRGVLSRLFPKNGASVPEYRFSGFTGDWEQRKLEQLCAVFTDGDWIEAKDQSNAGVRLIQTGNIGVTQYLDKPTNAKWISEDTFNCLKCEEVFEGDILISRLPEPAGRACIMPNLDTKMITAVDCTIVGTLPEVNSTYLVQYFSTERYFKEINACLAGGTRQRISRGDLAEFEIPLPNSAEEQSLLAAILAPSTTSSPFTNVS